MEDLKVVFAGNLIELRTGRGMTQAELGALLNYSDKAVSKWERAESLPDAGVIKSIAEIMGVSVDYMLSAHSAWEPEPINGSSRPFNENVIIAISLLGVWTLALLVFVIFWIMGSIEFWMFMLAVPISLITLLVLNSIWHKGRYNMFITCALVLGIFLLIYYFLRAYDPWQLLFVLVPAEILVVLGFNVKRRMKK
ncbi:MAG: helix-turn-helix transcriptional regulator [Clostridiales bacterium]|nr:helix-turn-helix transcriptional regulator [Clostridiales bacterium]